MSRHHLALRLACGALLVALLAGCSLRSVHNPFARGGRRGEERIQVTVQNFHFNDATIHAVREGERMRLGEVIGHSEKTFTVRWSISLQMEFEIHLIGGLDCWVRPMIVDPGDKVMVRIPPSVDVTPCESWKS